MSIPISVVILAKNEADNIVRCIQSLEWADEIVVVDDGSTDGTVELSNKNGARVVTHKFESFAKQRNWALDHADLVNDWVLMLDADEAATSAFAEAVESAISHADEETVGFRNCRKTMLKGKWLKYSDSFPVWIMRLVRRGRGYFQDSGHGEVPVPKLDGKLGTIKEPFIHYPFSRGLNDWLQRHIRYAEKEAKKELAQGHGQSVLAIMSLNRSARRASLRALSRKLPARGLLRFAFQYFVKRGFMDGTAGLQFCRLMGQYESMITVKKWELQHRCDES